MMQSGGDAQGSRGHHRLPGHATPSESPLHLPLPVPMPALRSGDSYGARAMTPAMPNGFARSQPSNPYLSAPPWLQMNHEPPYGVSPEQRHIDQSGHHPGCGLTGTVSPMRPLQDNGQGVYDNLDVKPRIARERSDGELSNGKPYKASKADTKKANKTQDGRKSCAECRRLKAKCDRVFPCSNCRKRGCALVCPDGDLSCMQGKRLVLASTEQLHERISELEAALAKAHRQVSLSTSVHPLLSAQHLDGGTGKVSSSPSTRDGPRSSEDKVSPMPRSSSQTSFTLLTPQPFTTLGHRVQQGQMAAESLLIDEQNVGVEGKKEDAWVGENAAPALIVGNAGTTTPHEIDDRQTMLDRFRSILRILPDRETARRQADHFWGQSMWYQNILRREEFEAIYEPSVYAPTPSNPLTPHKLACVLMVLTLDTYLDITRLDEDPLVMEYWDGVQRCFDTRFGWGASIAGIQALALITLFVGFNYRGAGASTFYWLRQMTSAAQQLGLHKDPPPSLPESERTFRRRVFHELYSLDCLISINHGQRTAIPLEHIETKQPDDGKALGKLKYDYMKNVKTAVIEIGCMADHVPKEQLDDRVQRLQKLLFSYGVEATPDPHCPILYGQHVQEPPDHDMSIDVANMTRATTSMCHFKALMFLFRPSLRRLIARLRTIQHPGSVALTESERLCVDQTFVASTSIIAVSGYIVRHEPRLATRLWSTWVQTFSAAVSLTAVAIWCGPYMPDGFVRQAYEAGIGGCAMISAHGCPRAQGVLAVLPILRTLIENRYPYLTGSSRAADPAMQQGEDMLFVLLGGQLSLDATTPATAPQPDSTARAEIHPAQPHARPAESWQDAPQQQMITPLTTATATAPATSRSGVMAPAQHWLHAPMPIAHSLHASQPMVPLVSPSHPSLSATTTTDPYALDPAVYQTFQGMDTNEIWARLQTFYEPALPPPVWHGGMGNFGFDAPATELSWGWTGEEFGVH